MYNKENRFRMWTFMFLYILALNVRQVAGDDSTQMLYVKLTIDESALPNFTLPSPFATNEVNVDGFKMTTMCEPQLNGRTKCDCQLNHVWSDRVCQSPQQCCGSQTCTFNQNSSHMCISNTAVTIKGFITLNGPRYENCLAQHSSAEFISCDMNLTTEMSEVFSTLKGFDVLKISSYSVGSVIANFELTIANSIMPQDLMQKSQTLTSKLSASFNLMTLGAVQFSSPPNPVCYYQQYSVSCSVQGDLNNKPLWQLLQQNNIFEITNGTGSEVTATNGSTVTLKNVTEFWAGVYTCTYRDSMSAVTISHTASAVMDVSTLPDIDITTDPGFPRCRQATDLVKVRVICDIGISSEPYNVAWTSQNIKAELNEVKSGSPRYAVDTYVSCSNQPVPQVTCTFKNRCSQIRSASVQIVIIYVGDLFCESDGDWEDTKAGYFAVIKCQNAHGTRQRTCQNNPPAQWEQEESNCVNLDLKSVLQSAIDADSGLGSLDANAANVFSRLQNATNNTEAINTYANMNASVHVLINLSQKLNIINNESSVDDLLGSSSNLLEKYLDESWQAKAGSGNISLAERYLSAVEQLVEVTNITDAKKKTNIAVATCNDTQARQCTSSVFNVTVLLSSSSAGSAKTTGFKNLESFFPEDNDTYVPNSIIVSTTTQTKQLDSVNIQIDFPLFKKRPPNVEIKCVTWDNATRSWSSTGCSWKGPSHEERCVCSHLSSFAILMAQEPLEIYWVNELTYVGLSVSVLSLIINLAIEVAVWSAVVKTSNLYLRHTAHVHISLCLLVADGCFLASVEPKVISDFWCVTSVVLKHFCYLAMFFWMFALSSTLLHQAVFMFHNVSKKSYLRFSYILGYVCPLLIVTTAFFSNEIGARDGYYSRDTCWLLYLGLFRGSIHTFLIPVGIIVFTNVFSMVIVIILLLNHPDGAAKSNDKTAAKTVMRTVVLLTPIFGVTWIFGFFVMSLDLTYGYVAYAVNYAFTLLNAFQGLFILLTTCLGDRLTRDALLKRLRKNASASISNSTIKLDSTGTN